MAADTPSPTPQQARRGAIADHWLPQRSPFIGRDEEHHRLLAGFEAAEAGHGALVTLVGEPGIGKTAFCDQLASHIAARGGRLLVGHCYEQGSLSRPYQPFVEVLESYARACDADTLRSLLGSEADEIARIVPAIREQLHVQLSAPVDPQEDRLRLLTRVLAFLRSVAAAQPLVLVLEDLHDADRGTLDLLVHLGRNLEGTRLLVVGTYRDVEVDRAHPLSAALIDLRRAANFARVHLRGQSGEMARCAGSAKRASRDAFLRGYATSWASVYPA